MRFSIKNILVKAEFGDVETTHGNYPCPVSPLINLVKTILNMFSLHIKRLQHQTPWMAM